MMGPMLRMGDASMIIKYVVRRVAERRGKTATFMPKPLHGEAGSGMHFHQHFFKNGEPVFFDSEGYAGLSKLARSYVTGMLTHGRSLLALDEPVDQQLQATRSGVRGTGQPVLQFGQPVCVDPDSEVCGATR